MLTVIVPTHNRPDKLARCIGYYSGLGVNLIIVDSSAVSYAGIVPLGVEYSHVPHLNFSEKILFAASLCDSNLIALCADDDFLLKAALDEASADMKLDSSISISFGSFVRFDEGERAFKLVPLQNYCREIYKRVEDKTVLISRFMARYDQVLWSMYRKATLIKIFEVIDSAEYSNDNFIEITIAAIAVSDGKLNILSGVWGARELSAGEHWGGRHEAITLNDTLDIQKFVSYVSDVSSIAYAEKSVAAYISSNFVRKLRRRINTLVGFFLQVGQRSKLDDVKDVLR